MMSHSPILCSVITPVYNATHFLPRVVECVREQGVPLEHIFVDDCSTDDSLNVLHELAKDNPQIRVFKLSHNQGPAAARNHAIAKATGKYLAFLDSDDLWLPEKCSVQTRFMEKTDAAISFTDYRYISEDGSLVGRRLRGPNRIGWSMHHMTRYLGCLTIMINRQKCPDFHFPNISIEYRAEDFYAWSLVLQKYAPAVRVPHDLARYAVVDNSRSSQAVRAAKSVWKLFRKKEKLPFAEAAFYFASYCIFTLAKRRLLKPQWPRERIDGLLWNKANHDVSFG